MLFRKGFIVSIPFVTLLIVQLGHGFDIFGGKEVEPHSLPSMVLLDYDKGICGGTLIQQKWVLTAAHCIDIKQVKLGVHSMKAEEKGSRQILKVDKIIRHPCFDAVEMVNDLMLLKLKKGAKLTKTVKCLPLLDTIKDPADGTKCLVAGWGLTNDANKKPSDVLMSVNVTVIDRATCNSPEYYGLRPVITSSMICAGSVAKERTDTCSGDSGGPLICGGALVGVTSFGYKKCSGFPKKPGVYAFLSKKQLIWIKNTMKKHEI